MIGVKQNNGNQGGNILYNKNILKYVTNIKKIKLDNYELKLIIHSLNELRNSLISQNKDYEIVDEVLMKYFNVLNK